MTEYFRTCLTVLVLCLCCAACSGGSGGAAKLTQEEIDAAALTYMDSLEKPPDYFVVFRSDIEEENNPDIYLTTLMPDIEPRRITTSPSAESFPCITSNGEWIYFISDMDSTQSRLGKTTEIYRVRMDIRTGQPAEPIERLTNNDTIEYGLTMSFDAKSVAYMAASPAKPDNPSLYLADSTVSNPIKIVDGNPLSESENLDESVFRLEHPETPLLNSIPEMAASGFYLVFNAMDAGGDMDIWFYNIKESTCEKIIDTEYPEFFPSVCGGGERVVFERIYSDDINDESAMEIVLYDREEDKETRLTNDHYSDSMPIFEALNEWILFTSKRWDFNDDGRFDEALFYMNLDDQQIYKLTIHPNYEEQAMWTPFAMY